MISPGAQPKYTITKDYLLANYKYWFKLDIKYCNESVSISDIGRLFQARIVDGKKWLNLDESELA